MLLNYIKSDLYRYTGKISFSAFIKHFFITPGFKFFFFFRICKHLKTRSKLLYLPFRIILRHYGYKFGYDIPVDTSIGYGLYVGHFGGIVISSKARIGNNCNISHGITIGYNVSAKNQGYPVIGNNVFIGPGAVIVGNIKVGDNVAIGANAVVTKSCLENEIVGGVPAKVISKNGSQEFIKNIWL